MYKNGNSPFPRSGLAVHVSLIASFLFYPSTALYCQSLRKYITMATAIESKQNEGDLAFPQSAMINREVEGQENDQNPITEKSLRQSTSSYSLQQVKSAGIPPVPEAEFKPTTRLFLAFGTLAVITLMVALDGTSLSVALPVGFFPTCPSYSR